MRDVVVRDVGVVVVVVIRRMIPVTGVRRSFMIVLFSLDLSSAS